MNQLCVISKKIYEINSNMLVINVQRIMNLESVNIGMLTLQTNQNKLPEFLPNLLNIDVSYAIICLEKEPIIYLNYFDHSNAIRCSESIIRKFKIVKINDSQIKLINQNDDIDQIADYYNSIIYDEETEELKCFFEIDELTFSTIPDLNLKSLFENNLMYFTFDQSDILINFYQFNVENIKSSHPVFYNMLLKIMTNNETYYYSEIQNYNICCGGGEYSFIQAKDYESAKAYDFWLERY